jgi:DNA-binding protein HU-beta
MTDRLKKEDFVRLLATRMNADEATATAWVDGIVETLYESFKAGKGVTLPGFGGFYVRSETESWVFKFNPGQRLRALFGWSSTYSGEHSQNIYGFSPRSVENGSHLQGE